MKLKTTFSLLLIPLTILLSVGVLDVQADSSCASYSSDYQSAVEAFNAASEALDRAKVAITKATPYATVPPEYKHLEEEYKKDPEGFFKKWKQGVSTLPNMPKSLNALLEILNTLSDSSNVAYLKKAHVQAYTAYNAAKAAHDEAKEKLEKCQGMTVVTIWCERGASCQNLPGVQGRPKAHYVFDCPDKIKGLLGIKVDCPGTWWSCDGTNTCPRSSDHVAKVVCRGPCGKEVVPKQGYTGDSSHQTTCLEKSWHSETVRISGQTYTRKSVKGCPQGSYYHCNIGLKCPNGIMSIGSIQTAGIEPTSYRSYRRRYTKSITSEFVISEGTGTLFKF